MDNSVVDRSGDLVADSLPGFVAAMSDDHVVLIDPDSEEYAVYRRLR